MKILSDYLGLTTFTIILIMAFLSLIILLLAYLLKRIPHRPKQVSLAVQTDRLNYTLASLATAIRLQLYPEMNRLEGIYRGRAVRIDFFSYDDPQIRIGLYNHNRLRFKVWSRQRRDPGQRFEIHPYSLRNRYFAPNQPLFLALHRLPNLDFNLDLDIKHRRYHGDHLICTLMFNYHNTQLYESLLTELCRLCDIIEQD